MKIIKRIQDLVKTVKQELNKVVIGFRVFTNCLLLYFENGATRFYSKKGLDWGATGSMHFASNKLDLTGLSDKLNRAYDSWLFMTEQVWVKPRYRKVRVANYALQICHANR